MSKTKTGLEMLKQSSSLIKSVQTKFLQIDDYCRQCKVLLMDFEDIKDINTAKKHLDKTMHLLENFRDIPKQADELIDLVDQKESRILRVYKRMRYFVRLRQQAYDLASKMEVSMEAHQDSPASIVKELDQNFERVVEAANTVRLL